MHRVTLISGDGIGPEVTAAARSVVEASGAAVEFELVLSGQQAETKTGTPLPAAVFESVERTKLMMKGPTYTPFGSNYRVTVDGCATSVRRRRPIVSKAWTTLRARMSTASAWRCSRTCTTPSGRG